MENILQKHSEDLATCRYAEHLESLLNKLGTKKVLKAKWNNNYQGDVDVDVLLEDGRVFSYYYSYGSCSGCDGWESDNLTDEQIEKIMETEATFFSNQEYWQKAQDMKPKQD